MLALLVSLHLPAAAGAVLGDLDTLAGPCVKSGTEWWCWGDVGGGLSLAHVPELDGMAHLVTVKNGVCGLRKGALVCAGGTPRAFTKELGPLAVLSEDGQANCVLARSGKGVCAYDDAFSAQGLVALTSVDDRWIGVTKDGRVKAHNEVELGPLAAMEEVVQVASTDDVACARTRGGAVSCVRTDLVVNALPDALLTTAGGVTDAVDVGVGERSVCILHKTGRVSCATNDAERYPGLDEGSKAWEGFVDMGLEGIRDLQLASDQLCVAEARQVRCNRLGGLAEFLTSPVPVPGLAPVVHAAIDDARGCAVGQDGTLWCWGDLPEAPDGTSRQDQPPTRVARDAVDVVATSRHFLWLDTAGQLHRFGGGEASEALQLWSGDATGVALRVDPFWVQVNGWDYDILCAQRPPEARCVALDSRTGRKARQLPDLGAVQQAIPADPLFVVTDSGDVRALARDLRSWVAAEAWKGGPPAGVVKSYDHEYGVFINNEGQETYCSWEDGPPAHIACEPGDPRKSVPRAWATTWELDAHGSLWRTYPGEKTLLLADVVEARSVGGYGITAVTEDGRAWVFEISMASGATASTGLWGEWTVLSAE